MAFTNGFVVNSLCCPSRSSILTGRYSHSTGVYLNGGPNGGFASFRDESTLATWLDAAGYRTGFVGKYLNGHNRYTYAYVPPGWDRWVAFAGPNYYNYGLSIDGVRKGFGSRARDYFTDVLATYAESFIQSSSPEEPLFLFFAPYAPHEPATPAPRHTTAFSTLAPWRPPSFNEEDASDKPAHIQALTPKSTSAIDTFRKKQYRSLLALDDAIKRTLAALESAGRLSNTLVLFTSDNGFMWGEHRWRGKQLPYEESIRVPYVIRHDAGAVTERTDTHLVANIDIAPTVAATAGVEAAGVDGMNLLPLLASPEAPWRSDLLIEHLANMASPTYCAVRNENQLYAAYGTGEDELYDLTTDPYQLQNQARSPDHAETVASLRSRLGELCNPPPPGFTPPSPAASEVSREN